MSTSRRPTHIRPDQLDMDSFFDFNAGTQPTPDAATTTFSQSDSISPFDEERQQFNGPSHDYGQFKQQVGLPAGSVANIPRPNQHNSQFDGFNSGIGDFDMGSNSGFGWNSGIDFDAEMGMDMTPQSTMPAMFFPAPNDSPVDNFVDPNSLGGHEEPASNVGRLWPGMHSQQAQQAAMQKAAQVHAVQQRQLKLQAQQNHYRQVSGASSSQGQMSQNNNNSTAKRASNPADPHVEESISRLLQQMRQNSNASGDDATSPNGSMLPHIARMKKDEDDMDEDERLLASEEGKKLSSKERRQLRNKVSARAFRSRRKEYIGQLEGEVAVKVQEANSLRNENQALVQENERYRGLIETLLRHPAFTPFINDISNDPSGLGMLPSSQQNSQQQQSQQQPQQQSNQQQQTQSQPPPQQQQQHQKQEPQEDSKPDYLDFDASQLQIPQSQPSNNQQSVGLAMIPENDFSKLNINGFNSMNFNNFSMQSAYAVTDVETGPDPVKLLAESPLHLPCSLSTAATTPTSTTCSSGPALTVLLAKLDNAAKRTSRGDSCAV